MSDNSAAVKPQKEQGASIESSLQHFLQIIVKALKKYSDNESEIGGIEDKYLRKKSGSDLPKIMEDITECFGSLMKKLEHRLRESQQMVLQEREEYRRLEEILQKHEAENRGYLRESLQLKLIIDSQKIKLEDVEKEKQEATNSMKQHLTQKSKEILSLHNEIQVLKKKVEDLQGINDNQEFSIREYESQLQELPSLKLKCKQLQKEIEEYESREIENESQSFPSKQLTGLQKMQVKKEGSFKAMNISLNLKKTLNNEIKHSSDTDLSKHANTSASNRNRTNLNASSISTSLGTNTHANLNSNKLTTPSKIDMKGLISTQQNHLLSSSSRGVNSSNNQSISVYPLIDISEEPGKHQQQLSQVSQTQPLCQYLQQGLAYQQQQQMQQQFASQQSSFLSQQINKGPAYLDKSFTKQQLLKQIKESNNISKEFNAQKQKEGRHSHNNSSHNIETKDLSAYLNGGIILQNNSCLNSNEPIKQHKRSKSQQANKLKGALLSTTTGRTSSSLNQRNRALNSTHVSCSQDTSLQEYGSTQPKDSFIDVHPSAINANAASNSQISQHPFSSAKVNLQGNNNNLNSNNNNNQSGSSNQILQQMFGQNSGGRSGYGSSSKRVSSRTQQYK